MNVPLYMKVLGYLYLVLCNSEFLIGAVVAYGARAYLGGSTISLVTGAVVGLIIFEAIKYVGFN